MPYTVRRGSGKRQYKIIKTTTNEVVGSSTSKAKAKASIRARYHAEAGGKFTKGKRK